MIIKDLFTNLAVLISILFMYCQFTQNRPLNRQSSLSRKITVGICGGVLGNILLQYSIHVGETNIDLRHIPVLLLAFYAGAIPAYLSMALVILGRFSFGVNLSSLSAVLYMIVITSGAVSLSRSRLPKNKKLFLIFTWNNIIFSLFMSYLINDIHTLILIILAYWVVSYFGGFIAIYLLDSLRLGQLLFDKYRNESSIDGLTGLNNYRKFDDIFNNITKTIDEKKEKLSLLYIDIDFFKKINDHYGHIRGDEVLKQLGDILQSCTRSFDIVSRNGGEEFTVLLLDCPLEKAIKVAENIRQTVEDSPFHLSGEKVHITVSIGVSCYKETTSDVNDIVGDADKALYHAKNTGRNKVCVAQSMGGTNFGG